jgi:hypothetical protein
MPPESAWATGILSPLTTSRRAEAVADDVVCFSEMRFESTSCLHLTTDSECAPGTPASKSGLHTLLDLAQRLISLSVA